MANAINWFEIPVTNMDRAKKFYEQVLQAELYVQEILGTQMAFLPGTQNDVSGALCQGEDYKPSMNGSLIYLNGGENLAEPLARIEPAGGKVIVPKTKISDENGYFAMFVDSEGNKMAFHSLK